MASSTESGAPLRGVPRVLVKLSNAVERGEYYEAHQMYRTVYFRYLAQKKFGDCLELLHSGATQLLGKQQESSAADLSLLIIDTLEKRHKEQASDDDFIVCWIERIGNIVRSISATNVDREHIIQRAIVWSSQLTGQNKFGHPLLHKKLAQVLWDENNMEQARQHFLLCQDGVFCARMLVQLSDAKGFKSEVDLFIVQAVLQQLCMEKRQSAEETFDAYVRDHPQILRKQWPYKLPLLNFLFFLFRVIRAKDLLAFRTLIQLYQPSLARDPAFARYLKKIGVSELGDTAESQNERSGFGGIFGNLFSNLVRELDHGDNDDDDISSISSTESQPLPDLD